MKQLGSNPKLSMQSRETPFAIQSATHQPLVIFLHLPKTAGMTIRSILEREYSSSCIYNIYPEGKFSAESYKALPKNRRKKIKLVCGHFKYGLHEQLEVEKYTYFTLVRNPIDRTISQYYYTKHSKHHPLNPILNSEEMTLQEYVTSGLTKQLDNGQTRLLAGEAGYEPDFGDCSDDVLDIAKKNLRESFSVVGTTERFDETLLLLKAVFGWQAMPFYIKKNVSKQRPKRDLLSPDIEAFLTERQKIDLALHAYSNELLDHAIKTHLRFPTIQLILFRCLNALYNIKHTLMRDSTDG